jgi:uncharacterized protein YecA (UPF0149 family)
MSLYAQWEEFTTQERTEKQQSAFWTKYFEKEKDIYAQILENTSEVFEGTIKEFSEKYEQDLLWSVGFMDGINTSLINELNINELEEDTKVKLEIDFEKLLYNMYAAKAEWLYNLEQWEEVLPLDKRKAIEKEYKQSQIAHREVTIGRNDPCFCGSGKKFKKCCGK